MADNILVTPGTGATVAADDIGGVLHQRVKISQGADGVGVDVSSAAPLQVTGANGTFPVSGTVSTNPLASIVSTVNSTVATLGISGVFTGTSEEVKDYAVIILSVFSNVASATDGLSVQQSSDGTNWDILDTYTIPAASGKTFTFQPAARYYRVVYTNGGTIQASFRLQTIFHYGVTKLSSQRPSDAYTNETDLEQNQVFNMGFNGTTWDRLRVAATGILQVVLTAGSTVIGKVGIDQTTPGTTNKVDIGTNGTVAVSGTVTVGSHAVTNAGTFVTQENGALLTSAQLLDDVIITDNAAFTDGTTKVSMSGYIYDEVAGTALTENDAAAARINVNRAQVQTIEDGATRGRYATVTASNALKTDGSAVTQPVSIATNTPVGTVAHDGVDSGAPIKMGGRARTTEIAAVSSDDRVDAIYDKVGKQIIAPYTNPENITQGVTTAMTATTSTSLLSAPAGSLRNYVTTLVVSNSHATVGTDINIQDGSGGTTIFVIPAASVYGGAVINLPIPLRQPTAATALFCVNATTGASTRVSAVGYQGL